MWTMNCNGVMSSAITVTASQPVVNAVMKQLTIIIRTGFTLLCSCILASFEFYIAQNYSVLTLFHLSGHFDEATRRWHWEL